MFTIENLSKVKQDSVNKYLSNFIVSPLTKGSGITLGNALRRTLLSSVIGTSIFAVKVDGIKHEFSPIPTIKEDGIQLILNLKKLVIKIDSSISNKELNEYRLENWPTLKLDFKGKGVITGSDIKCPSGFIVVNKDLIIANAENENSALKLEIYATRGIGFKTFNENRELINSLGIIATDSNFSPVVQVSYKVEEIKVEKTSFDDELTISIATNGSMTPEECLENASRILINQLNLFKFSTDEKYNVLNSNIAPSNKKTISTSIIELNLSPRSFNKLKRSGIETIEQITSLTQAEIKKLWSTSGSHSFKEIKQALIKKGLSFKNN